MPQPNISKIQCFLANVAITPSAVRRNPAGTHAAVIEFLSVIPLQRFANRDRFPSNLDTWTEKLRRARNPELPFGTSRKCLNIFLRDATYNIYTRQFYNLQAIEPLLEVPLDSHVANGLRADGHEIGCELPHFGTIIGLTREDHERFQCAAEKIAHELHDTYRVHLDLHYWRG